MVISGNSLITNFIMLGTGRAKKWAIIAQFLQQWQVCPIGFTKVSNWRILALVIMSLSF